MKAVYFLLIILLFSCSASQEEMQSIEVEPIIPLDFSEISLLENHYKNFNSVDAINEIVEMENQYFFNKTEKGSKFYGTIWREQAETEIYGRIYKDYLRELKEECDSMHCTIYAVKALKAGMGKDFEKLQKQHEKIWNDREHAGWSLGHLLVKNWGWKAYSIIDRDSEEFDLIERSFKNSKQYPVWRQPNIKLEAMYIKSEQDSLISKLLMENEFGWGFSDQGYHTWITRFDVLKECNWLGAPADKYDIFGSPLFIKTPFLSYTDYRSHVVIFPPKSIKRD